MMKKSIFIRFFVVIVIMILVASLSLVFAEEKKKVISSKKFKPVNLLSKMITLKGWVVEPNCTDRTVVIVTTSCKRIKIAVDPSKCDSWGISKGDLVKVVATKGKTTGQLVASSMAKITPYYFTGVFSLLNCVDRDVEVSMCNGALKARIVIPRDECAQYSVGNKVKVTGNFSYSVSRDMVILTGATVKLLP